MQYDFSAFKEESDRVGEWLKKEFMSIRTGRATPTLLDAISIDSYGTRSPISHVAGITTEDARTLRVAPWDKGHIKEIEKAIVAADLGVSVSVDDVGLRVSFPELTSERRDMLKRLVGEKLEAARVSLRSEREKIWNDIQKKEKDGEMSEDDKFRSKEQLQEQVDKMTQTLEEMAKHKEQEIAE